MTQERRDVLVAVGGVVGLFLTLLAFLLGFAAHFNAKLSDLEHKVAEQCVTKDTYDRHNHGGTVPAEDGR